MEILLFRSCNLIRLVLTMIFLFPLLLSAETIVVKTKAPQNRNAVFQYRVPVPPETGHGASRWRPADTKDGSGNRLLIFL